jgi:hypothetical protein
LIVLNSLFISKGLPFKRVFKLINSTLLHRLGDIGTKYHICNDDTLHVDTLITQVGVQMLKHTLGVLSTSKGVCVYSLNRSTHGTHSFLNIGIDELINLRNISSQLLNIILLLRKLKKE